MARISLGAGDFTIVCLISQNLHGAQPQLGPPRTEGEQAQATEPVKVGPYQALNQG